MIVLLNINDWRRQLATKNPGGSNRKQVLILVSGAKSDSETYTDFYVFGISIKLCTLYANLKRFRPLGEKIWAQTSKILPFPL